MTEKQKKIVSVCAFLFFLLFFLLVTVFLGKPLISLVEDPDAFRAWVEEKGWSARLIFIGMVFVQVVVALIPGEPLEIGAGAAFGSVEGTLLCLAGIALGSLAVFLLVRLLGVKMVEVFFPIEKIRSLRILQNAKRFDILLFVIMMIPGTPKDLLSYFVGLTEMKAGHWVLLTTLARIPSVVTSTVGGNALGEGRYLFALILFAATCTVSILGAFFFDRFTRYRKRKKKHTNSAS